MDRSDQVGFDQTLTDASRTLKSQAIILGGFILLIWLLELIDLIILGGSLDGLGIRPRTLAGLKGIIFMPFLHGSLAHVLANTIPFVVLGWLIMTRGIATFFKVTIIVMLVSGLGVWLFGGANSVHVGASGLIFGYFGYLLLRAYFERSVGSIAVAILVLVLYGGFLCGVVPLQAGISWQAHLFGFIGGVLAAYALSNGRLQASP